MLDCLRKRWLRKKKKKIRDTRLPTLVANYSITSVADSTVRIFLYILSCLFPVVYFNSINSTPSSILPTSVDLLLPPGYFFCRTRAYPALRSASLIAALALYFFLSLSLSFLRAVKVLVLGFFFCGLFLVNTLGHPHAPFRFFVSSYCHFAFFAVAASLLGLPSVGTLRVCSHLRSH